MPGSLGIHFGNEFLRMAESADGGASKSVPSPQRQEYRTPCAVGVRDRSLWGWEALEAPNDLVCDLRKRLCDVAAEQADWSLTSVHQWAAQFFDQLGMSLAELPGPEGGTGVALTVPYTLGLRQRVWLRDAVEEAGLRNAALINDPEAAVLGYGLDRSLDRDRAIPVLVLDVGACDTVASVLELRVSDAGFTIDLLAYDREAEGVRSIQARVLADAGFHLSPSLPPVFQLEWEQFEGALRQAASGQDYAFDTRQGPLTLRGESVAKAIAAWRDAAREGIRRALARAGLQRQDIRYAIPAGGGCGIPEVEQVIRGIPRPKLAEGVGADEVCALGAARYAALRVRANGPPRFRSAEWPAIGLETRGGGFDPVLDINHSEGVPSCRVYVAGDAAADTMYLIPRQGFARRAECNERLREEPIELGLPWAGCMVKAEAVRQPDCSITLTLSVGDAAREVTLQAK